MLQQCAACTQTQSSATLKIKCFFHLFDIGKDASNGFIITDNVFRPIGFVKEFIWVEDMHYPEIADLISFESQWLPNDSPLTLDPNKEIDFYLRAIEAGLITRDEAAEALFGHKANGEVVNAGT